VSGTPEADGSALGKEKRAVFGRSLILFGLTTLVAAVVPALLQGPARVGAAAGVITAALATCVALGALKLTISRDIKQLVAAISAGFLIRMMMVAAGMLAARALDGDLIAFTAGFFGLYLVHQMSEIAVVSRRARADATEGKA
jgi:F0F1-type ATP synthase assembly protein I